MATYKAPVQDMQFVLESIVGMEQRLAGIERFSEVSDDLVRGVVEEAAKLIEGSLAPLNASGDEQGCRLEDGQVYTPDGFPEAWRLFSEGGWSGLSQSEEYGGQGLPFVLSQVLMEMMAGANSAFSLYPLLTAGACEALEKHGSAELQATYSPKLVSGQWSGTMCLTEPQAGSDLAQVKTRAEDAGDGSYRLNGGKIFITGGEHDMAENIIHLVLARLPDAPAGIRGISMFLVPKFLPDADGNPGERNGVNCANIEKKMGIHAASTCVLNFDDAVGWLVGEEHQGIQNMFTMMNLARLGVGNQGLGICEAATQNAIAYALDRKQGRPLARKGEAATDTVLIAEHPDVRRMLFTMKAFTEGGRVLAYEAAASADVAAHHPDDETRQKAQDFVDLMTPICKAWLTDAGCELAGTGVQVFGGHGFIREHGMEQFVRDARINTLYEGTNGIQAMDLVARKLKLHNGRLINTYLDDIATFISAEKGNDALAFIVQPLGEALDGLREATERVREALGSAPDDAGAAAYDYLQALSLLAVGYAWARMARAVQGEDTAFARSKLTTARFFARRLLPRVHGLLPAIYAGADELMALPADELA